MRRKEIFLVIFIFALISSVYAATADMSTDYLAGRHVTEQGLSCADCHGDGEGNGVIEKENCLSCHEETDIIEAGKKQIAVMDRNPHLGHYPDLSCAECHQGHDEMMNFCDSCHAH